MFKGCRLDAIEKPRLGRFYSSKIWQLWRHELHADNFNNLNGVLRKST